MKSTPTNNNVDLTLKTIATPSLALLANIFCVLLLLSFISTSTKAATITVGAGGNLQAALDAAQPGDTIVLEAGAVFTGTFTLRNKNTASTDYITLQSSLLSQLLEGRRVSPEQAPLMPVIASPGSGLSALTTETGAHHYRLLGIEVRPANASAFIYDLIRLGSGGGDQNTLEKEPHHFVIDRCYIHAFPEQGLKRGIALNARDVDITNSYLSEFKERGQEAQAILGWNGSGNYRIINNHIEGAGENMMFGGATAVIPGLVPTNIEIRRNRFYKPVAWRGVWTVKNIFELKSAQQVIVDGNVFENNWADAQNGTAILFTVRDEGGANPQNTVSDVQFTNNIVRNSASALNIYGSEGQGANRINISNNLFDNINSNWGAGGTFLIITETNSLTIDHNTIFHTYNLVSAHGVASQNSRFTNNLAAHNQYGVHGDGFGVGNSSLNRYFPGAVFTKNVLAGGPSNLYPAGNFFPGSLDDALFVNRAAGNYRLQTSSPFHNAGTDGKDIGCDFDQLEQAISGNPPAPPLNGIFVITLKHSGKVLDVSGVSQSNGASIIQWERHNGVNQRWRVEPLGNGFYRILAFSGKALEVYDFSTANGSFVTQWEYHGGDNQQWRIEPVGAGYYKILNKHSGKALEVYGLSTANGGTVTQWDHHGGDNQQWQLEAFSSLTKTTNKLN